MCTTSNVTAVDPFTVQVWLATDDTLPGCLSSSMQGRLRDIFMDSRSFSGLDPDQLRLEDGTIAVQKPLCTAAGALLDCQGQRA